MIIMFFEEDMEESICKIPVLKMRDPKNGSFTPISIAVTDTIGSIKSRKLLKVLSDPGSAKIMHKASVVPDKVVPTTPGDKLDATS